MEFFEVVVLAAAIAEDQGRRLAAAHQACFQQDVPTMYGAGSWSETSDLHPWRPCALGCDRPASFCDRHGHRGAR